MLFRIIIIALIVLLTVCGVREVKRNHERRGLMAQCVALETEGAIRINEFNEP